MTYLLDTNTCIGIMQGNVSILARVSLVSPGDCAISTVTGYELYTGIAKCASPDSERAKVARLLNMVRELPFDRGAAEEAGRIRGLLESRGMMIGPYDVLIAAQALSADLTLVTANLREFRRVPQLRIENWQVP